MNRLLNVIIYLILCNLIICKDGNIIVSTITDYNDNQLNSYDNHRHLTNVIPNLSSQAKEERNYLKLHKCKDTGEAYSASYLINKIHLIDQFTDYNLTWVNCEMGSFIMMNGRANPNINANGTIVQSLDVLDFSVIHLSAYERLQRRWAKSSGIGSSAGVVDTVITSAGLIKNFALYTHSLNQSTINSTSYNFTTNSMNGFPNIYFSPLDKEKFDNTVVVMPFLGTDMGAGHSKLNNRLQYLHACFWSFYTYIPNVVVYVKHMKDYEYCKDKSELPFYDVILLTDLPKSASLPVATVQQTKARILDGRWNFSYIFFTESDQILMFRIPDIVYEHLDLYPRRLALPHRLMPYPDLVLTNTHERNLSTNGPFDWLSMNCCMKRQNCVDRKDWISIKNKSVNIVNVFGLQVPLGNTNFHEETYRHCELNELGDWPYCS